MKSTTSIAMAVILMGAVAPTTTASNGFDVDAWAEHCLGVSESVATEFDQYPNGVPADVAQAGVQRINVACYETLPTQAPTAASNPGARVIGQIDTGLLDNLPSPCAGAVSTATGWSDSIVILGKPFNIHNGPAQGGGGANGYYIKSTFDEVVGGVWFFLGIPMSGYGGSMGYKCVGGTLTELSVSLSGFPAVWPLLPEAVQTAIPPPLYVEAGGTLCFLGLGC